MDKKIRITYTVNGMDFTAEANTVPKAYEYIKAIVGREVVGFSEEQEDTLRDDILRQCMKTLVQMSEGQLVEWETHFCTIEMIQEEPKND